MGDESERQAELAMQAQAVDDRETFAQTRVCPDIRISGGFKTTPTIAALATALAAAQGAFTNPAKDKTARVRLKDNKGEYTFHYADLASVMDAIRTPLATNGLAIIQAPRIEYLESGALITLSTRLIHSSGEWIETEVAIGAEEQRAQVVASAITYAKRYSIQALLGVVAEEDDDGNAASGNTANISTRPPVAKPGSVHQVAGGQTLATNPSATANQPLQATPGSNANVARFDRAKLSLSRKMGFDEADHQITAIKRKHPDTVPGKLAALVEIEALDFATPTQKDKP